MTLGPHTVTLLRAPFVTDAYGNEGTERDWAAPVRTDVPGCSVQPARSDEYVVDREAVIVRLRAFCPGLVDVESTDRAEFDGDTYYIDGVEPWRFEPLSHTDLLLRRVEG
jgi:hypothetical protein